MNTMEETVQIEREKEQAKRFMSYQRDRENMEISRLESEGGEEKYRIDNYLTGGVYFVEIDGQNFNCNCPYFVSKGSKFIPHLKCKHIFAVESWKAGKELRKNIQSIEEILRRKFRPEQIKQRPGSYGKTLDYLETYSVIERLNEAFGLKWSWEITDVEVLNAQVYCQGRLTVTVDGEKIVKEAFGGKDITTENSNLGDDLKSACSDALKKAATMLGVGLYLYRKEKKGNGKVHSPERYAKCGLDGGETPIPPETVKKPSGTNGCNTDTRASNGQLQFIMDLYQRLNLHQGCQGWIRCCGINE